MSHIWAEHQIALLTDASLIKCKEEKSSFCFARCSEGLFNIFSQTFHVDELLHLEKTVTLADKNFQVSPVCTEFIVGLIDSSEGSLCQAVKGE